jgi:hypothetical protein
MVCAFNAHTYIGPKERFFCLDRNDGGAIERGAVGGVERQTESTRSL